MAGKEYTAKDKIFSKMTREGLTEETLQKGSVKKIGQKSMRILRRDIAII